MGKETEILLKAQAEHFNKTEEKKVLLLGSSEQSVENYNLKRNLGWTDTDDILNEEVNKIMELNQRLKENVDSNILTEEYIFDYCLKNNYVLCNIKEYKGQIPKELLDAIAKFTKENDIRLESDTNISSLYLLCRFTDIQGDNNNLKRSKRYKKGQLPKIMLLQKLLKGQAYKENHYKIIFEMGVKKPIGNYINSLKKTSIKTRNFNNNLILFYSIIGLLLFITGNISIFSSNYTIGDNNWYTFLNLTWLGINIVLFIKMLLPAFNSHHSSPSVNSAKREYGEYIENDPDYIKNYLTNYIYTRYNYRLNILKTKIKDYTYCIILLLILSTISYKIIKIEQNHLINKNKQIQIKK